MEINWVLISTIPLIIIGYDYLNVNVDSRRLHFKLVIPSIALIMMARLFLMIDIIPNNSFKKKFHGKKELVIAIKNKAKGAPMVKVNSFQLASIYQFYAGAKALSYASITGRKSQYDLWNVEESLRGKKVFYIFSYNNIWVDSFKTDDHNVSYQWVDNFQAVSDLKVLVDSVPNNLMAGKQYPIKLRFAYYQQYNEVFEHTSLKLRCYIYDGLTQINENPNTVYLNKQLLQQGAEYTISVPDTSGQFKLCFGIEPDNIAASRNSDFMDITINQ